MSTDLKVIEAIKTNFQAIFEMALGEKANSIADVGKIMTTLPVDKANKVVLSWLGVVPPMERWKDERKMWQLPEYDYTIDIYDWANGLEVLVNDIKDDKLNKYPPRIQALAAAYYKAVNETMFGLLNGGATNKAYDGTAMFADTRVIGKSANIDNYLSGSYCGSESEIRTAIKAGAAAMAAFQDDWGKPLGLMPDTIVCSPSMSIDIDQALQPGVTGNVRPERAFVKQIISSVYINANSGLDFFMLCTTEAVKPLVFGDRQKPEFAALDKATDINVFMKKKMYYGADARFGYGFGDPRTAIMIHDS